MSAIELIEPVRIDGCAIRLTDTILGYNEKDLSETLKEVASEIGARHISYIRFEQNKSADTSIFTASVTYSKEWNARYFLKKYVNSDPVIAYGRDAIVPFDWEMLGDGNPSAAAFLADAANHGVGRHGLSIPVRNRRGPFRWSPSPAIGPRPNGNNTKTRIRPSCNCWLSSLIPLRTSISSSPCRASSCRGARSNV